MNNTQLSIKCVTSDRFQVAVTEWLKISSQIAIGKNIPHDVVTSINNEVAAAIDDEAHLHTIKDTARLALSDLMNDDRNAAYVKIEKILRLFEEESEK